MRIKRTFPVLIGVLVLAAAVVAIVELRKNAPPEPARLLPGADGFFYINLKWIRTFSGTGALPAVSHDADYEQFVRETGFQFERDLDQAAFAIHYPESWGAGTGGDVPEPRFSEVFVGKMDATKMTAYLKKQSALVDSYRGFDIYNIPLEGRTVRVAILSYDSLAVSNHPDPGVIQGILDRSRKLASPFGGPSLLRQYYKKIPLASLTWAIARITPEKMTGLGSLTGWATLFPKPAVAVISGRYLRALHLRAEAFTASDADAQSITEKIGTFLNVFRSAEISVGTQGTDEDVKSFFDSLKVEQSGDRAILAAVVPPGFIKKVLTETPPLIAAPAEPAASSANEKPSKPAKLPKSVRNAKKR